MIKIIVFIRPSVKESNEKRLIHAYSLKTKTRCKRVRKKPRRKKKKKYFLNAVKLNKMLRRACTIIIIIVDKRHHYHHCYYMIDVIIYYNYYYCFIRYNMIVHGLFRPVFYSVYSIRAGPAATQIGVRPRPFDARMITRRGADVCACIIIITRHVLRVR